MSAFVAKSVDFFSLLALIATCEKVAISVNATKDAGGGTHPVGTACGLKISCGVREATMQVQVKLFATLCRYVSNAAPGIPFVVELPEGATLADLVSRLKLPREEVKVFFVKGRARPAGWLLEQGDEVGIFPLIAGG